jgi:hypothetical protein
MTILFLQLTNQIIKRIIGITGVKWDNRQTNYSERFR